ncbi:MAG: prepilin-type N-terminal cleavage/methylation domain-containing protein [Verrucomicrobia bacterium]|nr:prepilin-type N-terminal cleavage/methylation domain-containing protein [Verrucomicrobiota bacterium]
MPRRFLRPESGLTLIELLVTLAIVGLIAAFTTAAVNVAGEKRKSVQCLNQLRQLGVASLLYAADNDMTLPASAHQRSLGLQSWTLALQNYAGGKVVFRCPCDEDKTRAYTYVINDFLTPAPAGAPDLDFSRLASLERAGETVLFAEASKTYKNTDHFHFSDYRGQPVSADAFLSQVGTERHRGSANYLFADGRVESLTWKRVQARLRDPQDRFVDPTRGQTP